MSSFFLARNCLVVLLASILAGVLNMYGQFPFTMTDSTVPGLPDFAFPQFSLEFEEPTVLNKTVVQEWGTSEILSVLPDNCIVYNHSDQ